MKVRMLEDCDGLLGPIPKGTEISHKDAWVHLEMGRAEPVDDEAKEHLDSFLNRERRLAIARAKKIADDYAAMQEQEARAEKAAELERQKQLHELLTGGETNDVGIPDAGTVDPEATDADGGSGSP